MRCSVVNLENQSPGGFPPFPSPFEIRRARVCDLRM